MSVKTNDAALKIKFKKKWIYFEISFVNCKLWSVYLCGDMFIDMDVLYVKN